MNLDKFYAVTCVMNPLRYRSRVDLYHKFAAHMEHSGVTLYTIEVAFGDRPYAITDENNPQHIQVRSFDELWQKESALNVAISKLPRDWEYVAWLDADIQFYRQDWAIEIVHALQHHMVIQPWTECVDLGPNQQIIQTHKSFCSQWWKYGCRYINKNDDYYGFYHSGYAWAIRREAYESLGGPFSGGILDVGILGSGDHHMALGLVGDISRSCPLGRDSRYFRKLEIWQDRATRYIKKDIGYIEGLIAHGWHGKKKDRRYKERWPILIDNKFDPDIDVFKDHHGLWQLNVDSQRQIRLRDDIRLYFRSRNEDSVDL